LQDEISTMPENPQFSEPQSNRKPTVVGIGASAGGLAALKKFFEALPADSGLAFVVVVHLSPEHKSHLVDLLQPSVRFPVRQVTETIPLEENNVYVIPPNANLSAIDTHLRLSKLEEQRRERAPIDHFFRTLAATHDGHAIGVILTGTGSDGTLGLKEIKAKGGLILVQDPNEAEYDGMPQSAIATGLVDRVLPIAEIREALLRISRLGPRIAIIEEAEQPGQQERLLLPKVLAILRARTDRDFTRYKPATVLRRIARRMQLNYLEDFERYLERLREQPEETRALADDLLITVTSFFRDADVFEKLENEIVPRLFEGKEPNDCLRVWTVGCATGEEAYSVAMLLLEEAARRSDPPKIQIFASDLHKRSLDGAREGLYPGDIQTDVSPGRLKRFFQQENGGYRIAKDVRDTVVFAPHNLLGDPPFSRLDLITCRNLLIYLDRAVQRDVIDLFHYALCPHGYLLLGSAETIDASELFRTEDKKLCIYRKRNVPAPEPRLPVFPLTRLRVAREPYSKNDNSHAAISYQALHQNLLEQYAPPSILIGADNKVVHLSEHAGKYLVHPGGEVTASALRLVREELRIELQALLQSARENGQEANSRPIAVRFSGHVRPVVMHVRPDRGSDQDGFVLVIFEEREPEPDLNGALQAAPAREPAQDAHRIEELEAELNAARQRLQTIIEEYETSQEEMKASNEEMQSTNEELRSTMEELETSKEELQSINEELQTVNQENRHKVEELSQLSGDLQNLLSATDIATLFLDRDLRIMRFTPRLAELFSVRITDRGRPISDLTHRLGYGQLREDARAVLDRLIPVEREIGDDAGRWYLTRVLPYRSTEDRIEGVVITFIEITGRKLAEAALRESEERQAFLLKLADELRPLTDPETVQARAAHLLGARLGADRVFYAEVEGGERASIGSSYHAEGVEPVAGRYRLDAFGGAVPQVLVSGRTVVNDDVAAIAMLSATELGAYRGLGIAAQIKAPLVKGGRLLAFLGVHQNTRREWTRDEIALVEAVAERTWTAVERTYAEKKLRASEERLRLALDASKMGTFVYHVAEDRGEADKRMLALFGLPETGTLNLRAALEKVIYPEGAAQHSEAAARAADSSGSVALRHDVQIAYPDGSTHWLEIVAQAVFEGQPRRPSLVWGVASDITERKRAEAALRESEERQSFLLKLSDALRPLAAPAASAQTASRLLAEHLDASRAQYISIDGEPGNEMGEVLGEHVRRGRPLPRRFSLNQFGHALASVSRAGQTLVLTDTDRDPRISESEREAFRAAELPAAISVPLLKEGRLLSILSIHSLAPRQWTSWEIKLTEEVADRTWAAIERGRAEEALRATEERVRLFVENVREYALVQTDSEGIVTDWNPGAQRLFGYRPEQMLGRNFEVLLTPEDRDQGVFSRELAIVTQGQRHEDARWFQRQDESRLWGRSISEPILDEDRQFRGVAKIIGDETERQISSDAIRHSLVEKEELLKEVHHRVKNNLQVIVSLLNMQAFQIEEERVLALFQETRNRVLAISSIHEQLYSSESFASISLSDYARRLAPDLVRFYGLEERIQIQIEGDHATLELERAVPYGMLLNELVSNACKHAFPAPRTGVLRIAIRPDRRSKETVLTVADNGVGLPAGFDRNKVSSLGLKLVNGLVRQLRGELQIESKDGTTVTVRFPATGDEREK